MPVFQLTEQPFFPPPELAEENGLLAIGGDLRPARLIAAYRQGIFPWYSEDDPLLWWFTSPRLVLIPKELHISRRLGRKLKQQPFRVTYDLAFGDVILGCASSKRATGEGTWIVPEMQSAYLQMHNLGYAHSVECWQGDTLVGGLYGLRLDRVFFGESMFTRVSDASKFAMVALARYLIHTGVQLIDCQMTTQHLLHFGAREISGASFRQLLRKLIQKTTPDGKWSHDKEQADK